MSAVTLGMRRPRPTAARVSLRAVVVHTALAGCAGFAGVAQALDPPPVRSQPASGLRIDEPVVERPTTVPMFGRPVELTGYWEYSHEERREFDLDRTRARNRRIDEHELKLNARTRPSAYTEVLLQLVGTQESRQTQGSPTGQHAAALKRGQAWVRFDALAGRPVSLQLGRIALVEPRAWWWDEDLDAARLRWERGAWRIETGVAKELARVSSADRGILPERDGVVRWFGHATWAWAPRHSLQGFWLLSSDRSGAPSPGTRFVDDDAIDPSDVSARWIGVRATGQSRWSDGMRLNYWVDAAMVNGRETLTDFDGSDAPIAEATRERQFGGRAFDAGVAMSFPGSLRPTFSISRAQGSGGRGNDGPDLGFRQTGLQENKARRGGAKRLALYGELLRPELSNLAVTSLGAGVRLRERSSIEFVAHHYRQRQASPVLAGARLSTDPLGRSPDIGTEYDVRLAWREWRQFELILTWARFRPGAAFAESRRTPATLFEIGIEMSF